MAEYSVLRAWNYIYSVLMSLKPEDRELILFQFYLPTPVFRNHQLLHSMRKAFPDKSLVHSSENAGQNDYSTFKYIPSE